MRIIVLGAGVIGVTSAYFLAKAGHEVTVLDRRQDRRWKRAMPMPAKCRRAIPRPGQRQEFP